MLLLITLKSTAIYIHRTERGYTYLMSIGNRHKLCSITIQGRTTNQCYKREQIGSPFQEESHSLEEQHNQDKHGYPF